ncbi:MAG: hypothetical protein EXR62_06045 [Chloroflexi bacterium]|nr:hypothetical protein [Chloroflexota bacterium]
MPDILIMLKTKYLVPLFVLGLILLVSAAQVNAQVQNPIQNLRLSLNAGGQGLPSYTDADYGRPAFNAPIGTKALYIVFEYTASQHFDMRVKSYSPKGDPLLDRVTTYPPASNKTESIELTYPNGAFPDFAQYDNGRYLINLYRGAGLTISDQFYFKLVSMTPTTTPSVTPGGSVTAVATETGTPTTATPSVTSTNTPLANATPTNTTIPGQATATLTSVSNNNTTPTVGPPTATTVQGQTVATATVPPNAQPSVPIPSNTPIRTGYPAPGQTGANLTPQSIATVARAPQSGVPQNVATVSVPNPPGQAPNVSGNQGAQAAAAGNPAAVAAVQLVAPAAKPAVALDSGQVAIDPNTGLPVANVPGSQEPFGTPLADFQIGTAIPQNEPSSPLASALATWVGALVAGGVALWLWRSRPQGTI